MTASNRLWTPNRRQLLLGSSAMTALMGLPLQKALAAEGSNDLKFIFVYAAGGWDNTRVFAPQFDENVDMEIDADKIRVGDLTYVSHATRPAVDQFFSDWGDQAVVLNGMLVRSIAHEICTMLAFTGATSGLDTDWATALAADQKDRYTLPHLILGGPSFAGTEGVAVVRAGAQGQLEGLLSGAILDSSDLNVPDLLTPSQALVDRFISRRAQAYASGADASGLGAAYASSLERAQALKDLRYMMGFSAGAAVADQAAVAVEALALGISRCTTLLQPGSFDTHADNDVGQAPLWESLFDGLGQLMRLLDLTPSPTGRTLREETVVVVLSEMARTPLLNAFNGKDHWPYTSALMVGPMLRGGQVIGGYDSGFYGLRIDPNTGESTESGDLLMAETLGATLLAMADIDPGERLPGVEPLWSVIA